MPMVIWPVYYDTSEVGALNVNPLRRHSKAPVCESFSFGTEYLLLVLLPSAKLNFLFVFLSLIVMIKLAPR